MKSFTGFLLVLAVAGCGPAPQTQLQGTWTSEVCESMPDGNGGTTYFTRTFKLTEATWWIDYSTFADAACTPAQKLVTVQIAGDYYLEGDSHVAGTHEARFLFASRHLAPRNNGAAAFLNSISACGFTDWAAGEWKDIDPDGCAVFGIRPRSECTGEYDLVKRDGDRLYLGKRPADGNLCTPDRRPQELTSVAVVRTGD